MVFLVRTPWVVRQLWRGTDGVSRRKVAFISVSLLLITYDQLTQILA